MHYADIAEAIAERGYRTQFGATPANDVSVAITSSLTKDLEKSPFVRVSRGIYGLRAQSTSQQIEELEQDEERSSPEASLVNAFGMYWSRDKVLWEVARPQLWGQQQMNSKAVDFANQSGTYLLHDGRSVIYVGRVIDQTLSVRLKQHTVDRLNGRWSRFSWFGVYSVQDNGSLRTEFNRTSALDIFVATMEALLIEGLEPPQNRKRGDDFRAVEYLQKEDPAILKLSQQKLMDELKSRL